MTLRNYTVVSSNTYGAAGVAPSETTDKQDPGVSGELTRGVDDPAEGTDMTKTTALHYGSPVLPPRFWTKTELGPGGCWLWIAGHTSAGYGTYTLDDRLLRAHRVAYEALVGEIPAGLVLDHLCRVRPCVNPAHLEPVTHRTNILRGEAQAAQLVRRTHCIRGHEFTPANTRMDGSKRRCRACKRERTREYRAVSA